jgi:hypothetical protein
LTLANSGQRGPQNLNHCYNPMDHNWLDFQNLNQHT